MISDFQQREIQKFTTPQHFLLAGFHELITIRRDEIDQGQDDLVAAHISKQHLFILGLK